MYFQEPERPSIIQEIVNYDKPNFRNTSATNSCLLTKPNKRIFDNQKNVVDFNRPEVDVSIKIENIEETPEAETENESHSEDMQDTSTEQEDSKSGMDFLNYQNDTNCSSNSQVSRNTILLKKYENDEETLNKPFKKPRGRPKKSSLTPKKADNNKGVNSVEEAHRENGPPRRGRPKKSITIKSDHVNSSSNEKKDVVQPKKRGRKRKIHNEVFKQNAREKKHTGEKGDVEAEIESMFNAVEEAENAMHDLENDDEEYDSEDSRQEWIPEEYVEYKQQHLRRMKNDKKTFPCKFCKVDFSSYYAVRKHRALEHNDVGKDRKQSEFDETSQDDLDMCSSDEEANVGSDNESLAEWMPDDYAEYKMKHSQDKMKRSQWYKCKICCAVFSNYYKLSKHKLEHKLKPNPYECNQCNEKFKDIDLLMAHIRVHQGKDPYQCKKCDKGFSAKEELDTHILIHVLKKKPTVKRFKCDVCSKEFSKLCDLERHTRVHTGEKPCECSICHKRFQQAHNLSKHLLIHLHVKPFQCEICNKKFGRVDVLNRHILTHSMEKPIKCSLCGRGFIRQIQLSNHQKRHHSGVCDEVEIS